MDKKKLEDIFQTPITDTRDNWRLLCPYHMESTPSFYVHKDDLVGHCFGCGVAGRLDILVSRFLGISPAEARKRLGLEHLPWLDSVEKYVEPTYPQTWIHAWRRISNHPYLQHRKFTNETVEQFQMRWDSTTKRVVWPLALSDSRVIGAVGRSTDGRDPKYLFYWNCDKGQSVWTAPEFWESKRSSVIVVEGILDAMWMWQAGYKNTVSLIGARATLAQKQQLKEFYEVTIALDNDKAGTVGALDLGEALKGCCTLRYIIFPEHVKDCADLQETEIPEIFSNHVTPLQMKLNADSKY